MKLSDHLYQKRWQILFTSQAITLSLIYAHRFGFLDKYVGLLEGNAPTRENSVQHKMPPAATAMPLWKKIAQQAGQKKDLD
jgi:hypothetical protein